MAASSEQIEIGDLGRTIEDYSARYFYNANTRSIFDGNLSAQNFDNLSKLVFQFDANGEPMSIPMYYTICKTSQGCVSPTTKARYGGTAKTMRDVYSTIGMHTIGDVIDPPPHESTDQIWVKLHKTGEIISTDSNWNFHVLDGVIWKVVRKSQGILITISR